MIFIECFTFNPFQENTYLLYDETKECIIIDPGCYEAYEKEQLANYIKENSLKPVILLNTHCHVDHILGNNFVYKKYGLKPRLHRLELPLLNASDIYSSMYGINVEPSPQPDIFLNEKDIIKFGTTELKILFTPGHSPGSLTFYNPEENIAIAGDVLFLQSIGRTDLPGGNYETLIKNIKEKLFTLDDQTKIYPGHGPQTTIAFEKDNNPFLNHEE